MRIVSLLPAATEIVAALGAVGRLVGVSHECDFPPEVRSLPRVTRTRVDPALPSGAIDRAMVEAKRTGVPPVEVDVDLVAHLRPDVLIGQSVCEVCAVGAGELARLVTTLMPTPWVVTLHAHTLDEVFLDIRKIGEALELRDEAEELDAGLRYRLRRVQTGASRPGKPRVLVLEWLDPPYVAGHWVPELVALAGGEDVGGATGEPSRPRPWDELEGLAPDGELTPLQRAFSQHHALQCGYCTPGMLMSAKALLEQNPRPSEEEIRKAIQGNICRCTGYVNIVEAIKTAAEGGA